MLRLLIISYLIVSFISVSKGDTDIAVRVAQQTHKGCSVIIAEEDQYNGQKIFLDYIREKETFLLPTNDLSQTMNHQFIDTLTIGSKIKNVEMSNIVVSLMKQKNCYIFLLSGSVRFIKRQMYMIQGANNIFGRYYFVIFVKDAMSELTGRSVKSLFEVENGVIIKPNTKIPGLSIYDVKLGSYNKRQMLEGPHKLLERDSGFPNMKGRQLRVGVLPYSPYAFRVNDSFGYDGADVRVLKAFSLKLSLTPTFVEPPDGEWGIERNGTWSGLIGHAGRGQVNMSLSGIGISVTREAVVDFSKEIYYSGLTFVAPVPDNIPQWQSLIRPFDLATWILIFLSSVFISITYYATTVVYYRRSSTPLPPSLSVRSLLVTARVICSESVVTLPRDSPSRMTLGTWFLTSTVILACYGGLITSLLINPIKSKPITTINDLASQTEVKWGKVDFGGVQEEFFMTAEASLYQKIWKDMIFVKDQNECIMRTVTDKFACIGGDEALLPDYIPSAKVYKGRYTVASKERFYVANSAIALTEGSPLKEYLDLIIIRLHEAGMLTKWWDELAEKVKKVRNYDEEAVAHLTLTHLTGAFYLWILGTCLGFLIFIYNVLMHRRKVTTAVL